ncbi:hypothetical protein ACFO6V_09395 [Promicromonospora alba]|uniref:Uncharacterized protein n=1 Tax=Promicromonospora alba TaxID=1616110 RepID=A0ABV9HGQ4_9MICO
MIAIIAAQAWAVRDLSFIVCVAARPFGRHVAADSWCRFMARKGAQR